MSKHDSAPTVGYVFSSQVHKYMAGLLLLVLFIVFVAVVIVRHQVTRDCHDLYKRDISIASFWVHIEVGKKKVGCPVYEP